MGQLPDFRRQAGSCKGIESLSWNLCTGFASEGLRGKCERTGIPSCGAGEVGEVPALPTFHGFFQQLWLIVRMRRHCRFQSGEFDRSRLKRRGRNQIDSFFCSSPELGAGKLDLFAIHTYAVDFNVRPTINSVRNGILPLGVSLDFSKQRFLTSKGALI